MRTTEMIGKNILKVLEKIIPATTFDRILIERRRRLKVNNVTGYYPHAVFFSKKRSKEKYCVVRYTAPTFAMFAAGVQYVFCYYKLLEKGYIPLIDIEYAYSYRMGRLGEHNMWDLCFKQTIPVAEASKKSYVLATGDLLDYSDDPKVCYEINRDDEDHYIHVQKENYKEYYANAKKYIGPIWQVKDELLVELDAEIGNKLKGKKVLGVSLRECFTKDVKYETEEDKSVYGKHPLLPGVKETIEIVKRQLGEWECDFIFLATVYKESIELFKEEFGSKVICIERERMNINGAKMASFSMSEEEIYRANQKKRDYFDKMTISYVKEVVMLSKCDYLMGGASSGMAAALVMNGGKYKDIHILEDERKIQRY